MPKIFSIYKMNFKKMFRIYKEHKLVESELQFCLLHTWDQPQGRQACEVGVQTLKKITAEVNPADELIARKQGGGLQLPALSPRNCIAGFSSEEVSFYSSCPATLLLLVGPYSPSCLGSRSITEPHHRPVLPLSPAMPSAP